MDVEQQYHQNNILRDLSFLADFLMTPDPSFRRRFDVFVKEQATSVFGR
jgi:hypothetical protein